MYFGTYFTGERCRQVPHRSVVERAIIKRHSIFTHSTHTVRSKFKKWYASSWYEYMILFSFFYSYFSFFLSLILLFPFDMIILREKVGTHDTDTYRIDRQIWPWTNAFFDGTCIKMWGTLYDEWRMLMIFPKMQSADLISACPAGAVMRLFSPAFTSST